jgi:hypothetical protein
MKGIHNDAVSLIAALKQATTDAAATTGPISESDGQDILNRIEAVNPTIFDALNAIVAKKPALAALPLGGIVPLVHQDLINLESNTTAFSNALIAQAPVSDSLSWELCMHADRFSCRMISRTRLRSFVTVSPLLLIQPSLLMPLRRKYSCTSYI